MTQFLPATAAARSHAEQATVDAGLRAHMLRVYNYLAGGIALAAFVSYAIFALSVTNDPALAVGSVGSHKLTAFGTWLFRSSAIAVVLIAPLVVVIGLCLFRSRLGVIGLHIGYWSLVTLMGAGTSIAFLVFSIGSIAQVFALTSAVFAGLSLWGYTTKRDISGWGTFLFMGLLGIILAGLLNVFLKSTGLQFAINCIGVLVFAGFTAYDTQQIKDQYLQLAGDQLAVGKAAVWGALELFLDFINLFWDLLMIFGGRE